MTKIWQSLWQPGLEASSALAFELGNLFSVLPRSLPTTIKSSSKEGSKKKIVPLIIFSLGSLLIISLGANQISPMRLWAPWKHALCLVLQRGWWVWHTQQVLSNVCCIEKLSRSARGKWRKGVRVMGMAQQSDSREQLVANKAVVSLSYIFRCAMPRRMQGVIGSSTLHCTLRPYLELSCSHLGGTFKSPVR